MTVLSTLRHGSPAGISEVAGSLADAARLGKALGWSTWTVDLALVTDKDGLMSALSQAAHLPEWFGRNWDALADVLGDGDHPPRGHLWLIEHAAEFSQHDPKSARMLRSVLDDASVVWTKRSVPAVVLWGVSR